MQVKKSVGQEYSQIPNRTVARNGTSNGWLECSANKMRGFYERRYKLSSILPLLGTSSLWLGRTESSLGPFQFNSSLLIQNVSLYKICKSLWDPFASGGCFLSFCFLPFCYTSAVIPDLGPGVSLWCVGRSPGEGEKADLITEDALQNRVAFPLVCELVWEVGVLVLSIVLEQQKGGVTGRWTVGHGFKLSSELHSHHNRNNWSNFTYLASFPSCCLLSFNVLYKNINHLFIPCRSSARPQHDHILPQTITSKRRSQQSCQCWAGEKDRQQRTDSWRSSWWQKTIPVKFTALLHPVEKPYCTNITGGWGNKTGRRGALWSTSCNGLETGVKDGGFGITLAIWLRMVPINTALAQLRAAQWSPGSGRSSWWWGNSDSHPYNWSFCLLSTCQNESSCNSKPPRTEGKHEWSLATLLIKKSWSSEAQREMSEFRFLM